MTGNDIIRSKKSPNYNKGRNGWVPDIIVCHISEGYENGVDWLCNEKSSASAHFFITKQGKIYNLVNIEDTAWCNGNTVSPENDKRHYSKAKSLLVRQRKTSANYYTVSIETEGFYNDGKGELNKAQLDAIVWLIEYIRTYVKEKYGKLIQIDREHLIGHYEVNPITKPNCPGEKFQFDEIIKRVPEWGDEMVRRYDTVEDLPSYAKPTIQKLINKGYLSGIDGDGKLALTEDMIRVLIVNDRAGIYQ